MNKRCDECNELIKDGEACFQVRYGYWDEDNFIAENDVAYYHEDCYPTSADWR